MANTNIVPQGLFGPGILWMTRTDIANGTPANIGFVNEFTMDISFSTKQLFGQNQFPLLVARGEGKATGKIKAAVLSGTAMNTMLIGGTWTNGTQYDATTTAATPIPVAPFTITPTVPSTGTFDTDLGVTASVVGTSALQVGQVMTLVTGTPTTGQYAVSAGVYTFASADNVFGVSVKISFAYHYTLGATGQSQIIQNLPIGNTPTFQLDYKTTLYGATYYVRLFNAVGSKFALQHKISDFAMPEYDFEFYANANQQIGIVSLASQA